MRLFPGTVVNVFDFGRVPNGPIVHFTTRTITETVHYLQLPINCVIAGQQKEPVKNAMGLDGAISGPMRGIFNE